MLSVTLKTSASCFLSYVAEAEVLHSLRSSLQIRDDNYRCLKTGEAVANFFGLGNLKLLLLSEDQVIPLLVLLRALRKKFLS